MEAPHTRAKVAAHAAYDKLAADILVLDVGDIIGIVESFVIASGSNPRQVKSIVDNIQESMFLVLDVKAKTIEGLDGATWVLLDYGDCIVHVFLDETREFYDLERLWADAPQVEWKSFSVESLL